MAQEQTDQKQLSQAFLVQLKTANHKVASLIDQRTGLLDQLTEIQVLHRIESANRVELQKQLNETTVQLGQAQEKTIGWIEACKTANDKVAALTWYCEQLLKQSPDSNGIHTIDNNLLSDIMKTHQAVLMGERVSTNIEDVIRVTTGAQVKAQEEVGATPASPDEAAEAEAPVADVVELDHGLSKADASNTATVESDDIESDDAVEIDIEVEDAVPAVLGKKKKR